MQANECVSHRITRWNFYISPIADLFYRSSVRINSRYAPLMVPAFINFAVPGISLIPNQTYACDRYTCTISLDKLESRTTGTYRCEVSGDAPEFKLDSQTANLTVAGECGWYRLQGETIVNWSIVRDDGAVNGLGLGVDLASFLPSLQSWHVEWTLK